MTLVIIDMQTGFVLSDNRTLVSNCRREIKNAIKNEWAIIFVEYKGLGRTIGELRSLTKKYPWVTTVVKNSDDGGIDILDTIFEKGYSNCRIRICGIYAELCVKSTVISLRKFLPKTSKITIVKDASRNFYNSPKYKFTWANDLPGVNLV